MKYGYISVIFSLLSSKVSYFEEIFEKLFPRTLFFPAPINYGCWVQFSGCVHFLFYGRHLGFYGRHYWFCNKKMKIWNFRMLAFQQALSELLQMIFCQVISKSVWHIFYQNMFIFHGVHRLSFCAHRNEISAAKKIELFNFLCLDLEN